MNDFFRKKIPFARYEIWQNIFDYRYSELEDDRPSEFTKSDIELSDKLLFVGRFGLWMTFAVFPFSIIMCFSFVPELRNVYIRAQVSTFLPSIIIAIIVAYRGKLGALILANAIAFIGVALAWVLSIEGNPGYVNSTNLYIHFPITAMLFVQNMVIFALAPMPSALIGFAFFCFTAIYPILRDPYGFPMQKPAILIYIILYLSILIFSIGIHSMFRAVNRTLIQSREAMRKSRQSSDFLNASLEASSLGIIGFGEDGECLIERNIASDLGFSRARITLEAFQKQIQDAFSFDVNAPDAPNNEFSVGDKRFLLLRKQADMLTIFAFVDITERYELEKTMSESQKLSLVGQLTSGIAHDYNNILSIALTNLEGIPMIKNEKIWQDYISPAVVSLEHAKAISHKLLNISSDSPPRLRVFNLGRNLENLKPILTAAVEAENVLSVTAPQQCFVKSDPQELNSAILNIVINARNVIQKPGGRIDINVTRDGEYWSINICDNGPGIPDEIKEKIFEPFFTTKKTRYSAGLGLAMVKHFLVSSGGAIALDSKKGRTEFGLKIPAIELDPKDMRDLDPTRDEQIDPTKIAGLRKVLLVDDNDALLRSTARIFEQHGLSVLCANSASHALTLALMHMDIDVAFLDLAMPDMDGIKLGQELMKINKDVNYFILTGNASQDIIDAATELGFSQVLLKPLRVSQLVNIAIESLHA